MIALGRPAMEIDVIFTDNPAAEAPFLESVYPGLRKTSVNINGGASTEMGPCPSRETTASSTFP